jgi:hypothetical protein
MTVEEAREISQAILDIKRNGKTLDGTDTVASGDTVVTANGEYVAWVLGDVAEKGKADAYSYILIKRFCQHHRGAISAKPCRYAFEI